MAHLIQKRYVCKLQTDPRQSFHLKRNIQNQVTHDDTRLIITRLIRRRSKCNFSFAREKEEAQQLRYEAPSSNLYLLQFRGCLFTTANKIGYMKFQYDGLKVLISQVGLLLQVASNNKRAMKLVTTRVFGHFSCI